MSTPTDTPPVPVPAPTPTPVPARPQWLTHLIAVVALALIGVGLYNQYGALIPWPSTVVPIVKPLPEPAPLPAPAPSPVPKPSPSPAPTPAPGPFPSPSSVWQPHVEPSKNEVDGLKLPAPQEVSITQKYVQVAATSDKPVRWLIGSRTPGIVIEALESPLTNSVLIFPSVGEDVIVVVGYSASAIGEPTQPAITYIKVNGVAPPAPPPIPQPVPQPTPTPTPVKTPTKLHVTFIVDPAKATKNTGDILNDVSLRKWIKDQGSIIHELSVKDDLAAYHLDTFVSGKQAPILVLQTTAEPGIEDGKVLYAATLTSSQQVKDAINKIIGGK
jgi:hypothetical protein